MNKYAKWMISALLLPAVLFASHAQAAKLWGTAEDLWGDKIDLSKLGDGVVVIHPISTSH